MLQLQKKGTPDLRGDRIELKSRITTLQDELHDVTSERDNLKAEVAHLTS